MLYGRDHSSYVSEWNETDKVGFSPKAWKFGHTKQTRYMVVSEAGSSYIPAHAADLSLQVFL